uniref:NB-ARC domain-containing protein n=1 Tax=Oryza glaberrima TaxID=4538 RepID=I1R4U7_ORYGL
MDLVFAGQSATDEVIANLIDKASSYLGSNPDRLQESMRMLRLKLPIMCDTLVPAQSRESYSGLGVLLDESLWRLRDAVEELEDAVDEHAYHEKKTKEREVSDGDLGSSFSKMKQRVIKSLANGRTLERRLRKAIEALDMVIVDIAKRLPSDVRLTHEQLDEHRPQRYRMTAGFPFCEERVLGREKETDVIVRWLIDPLNDDDAETQVSPNNHHVSVMSIVGHGGVGKTTLAQLVCNDPRVRDHFDMVAWLYVTSSFDVGRIMREIVECVTCSPCSSDSLENMQHILQDKINSTKAFLLVLDDVWEENLHEWEKLFSVLRGINTRIKILLTTRTQSVATLVESVTGCEDQHLRLHELEENGNLQIFCQLALADLKVGSEGYAELQSIGAKIVKKLGGTPVAIKIAAYQLRLCPTLEFWRRFLHRMDKEAVPNIMDVLKISYYRLSAELLSLLQLISKKSSIQKGGVGEDLDLVRIDISSIREKGRRVILGSIDCKFVP